jgi:hypothetical protein
MLAVAAPVGAEVVQEEGRPPVTLHGSLSPGKLPRDRYAPAELSFGFERRPSSDGTLLPDVSEIALDLDSRVSIDFEGMPVCPRRTLEAEIPPTALAACADARVGWGNAVYEVGYPGQGRFRMWGRLMAYNGRFQGRPAILVGLYFSAKFGRPREFLFAFDIRKGGDPEHPISLVAGAAGQPSLSEGFRLLAFNLTLRRNYAAEGIRHGFVSASCALPRGVRTAAFPLFRLGLQLDDGSSVAGILTKDCVARDPRP